MEFLDWFQTNGESFLRLIVAFLCGGIVGWDREWRGNPAGLRTHIMVAVGSAGFTLIGIEFLRNPEPTRFMNTDFFRIMDGIIGGIGFLGAGAIIRAQGSVHGLTTAAGIWVVAAIGIACGLGHYPIAVALVIISLITIVGGRAVKHRVIHTHRDSN